MEDTNFDLEDLVHVEQTFYNAGYEDGFAHGRIHGLIEGRALGREKGFEMWEELGFYEGFAMMWDAAYKNQQLAYRADSRTANHIKHLLDLISQFPLVNPSSVPSSSSVPCSHILPPDLDIPKLFRQIHSRYKALCASLGVRPLRSASGSPESATGTTNTTDRGDPAEMMMMTADDDTTMNTNTNISNIKKKRSRKPGTVWELHNNNATPSVSTTITTTGRKPQSQPLSF